MAIKIKNLSVKLGEKQVLSNLNYHFQAQTFTLLIGDTGSGKSTLLQAIAGYTGLTYDGQILVNDINLKEASIHHQAAKIGMIFQNPDWHFTMKNLYSEIIFALENLQLNAGEIGQRLSKVNQQLQLDDFWKRPVTTLSGGEKQRAALAVLLAMDPPIILLDEPFAGIDKDNRLKIIDILFSMRQQGKTIIISDHDFSDYQNKIDAVVKLNAPGQLIEENISILENTLDKLSLNPVRQTSLNWTLDLQNITLKQGQKLLLSNCDCLIKAGITTITGDNGVGKSTLLQAIVQQHHYQGQMLWRGEKLKRHRRLYHQVTMVVQEAVKQFVEVTVAKELAFSPPPNPISQARQKQALYDLGMDKLMERSVFHLSGGQQKILQLIVMLSLDTKLLILDEPFTGLDNKTCAYFAKWIQELSSERSFIIVTHRLAPLSGISHYHLVLKQQQLHE